MKARLNLLVLRSRWPERAARFYGQLGLDFRRHRHGEGPEHYACEQEGLVFELYPAQDEAAASRSVRLGFEVASVDRALERLARAGGRVLSGPADTEWGYRAVVEDPDGRRVEVVERSGEAP